MSHGADIEAKTKQGKTTLGYALRNRRKIAMAKYLIERYARVKSIPQSLPKEFKSHIVLLLEERRQKLVKLFDDFGFEPEVLKKLIIQFVAEK